MDEDDEGIRFTAGPIGLGILILGIGLYVVFTDLRRIPGATPETILLDILVFAVALPMLILLGVGLYRRFMKG